MTAFWFGVLGLFVGFLAGVAVSDAFEILGREKMMMHRSNCKPLRIIRNLPMLLVGIFVACLAACSVLLIVQNARLTDASDRARQALASVQHTSDDLSKFSACVALYQQSFGIAYQARYVASVQVSAAMDEIVRSVASTDRVAIHRAIDNYIKVREHQQTKQLQNPLPPLPTTLCGEPPPPPGTGG